MIYSISPIVLNTPDLTAATASIFAIQLIMIVHAQSLLGRDERQLVGQQRSGLLQLDVEPRCRSVQLVDCAFDGRPLLDGCPIPDGLLGLVGVQRPGQRVGEPADAVEGGDELQLEQHARGEGRGPRATHLVALLGHEQHAAGPGG